MAPWLPSGTLQSERAATPFVRAVGEWDKAWFGSAGWDTATAFERGTAEDWTVLREGAAFGLRGAPKVMLDLGFALFGIRPRVDLGQVDLRLLRRVAGKALDDLLERLGALVPAGVEAINGPRWSLAIGPAVGPLLVLEVAEAVLVAAARGTYRPVAKPAPLTPRAAAWGKIAIDCAAHLGRTSLAVQQIAALERGDIIVLDHAADQPVGLSLAGRTGALRCAIGEDANRTTLTLQD